MLKKLNFDFVSYENMLEAWVGTRRYSIWCDFGRWKADTYDYELDDIHINFGAFDNICDAVNAANLHYYKLQEVIII